MIKRIKQQLRYAHVVNTTVKVLGISVDEAQRRVDNIFKYTEKPESPDSPEWQMLIDSAMQIPSRFGWIIPILVKDDPVKQQYDQDDPKDCFLIIKRVSDIWQTSQLFIKVSKFGVNGTLKILGKGEPKTEDEQLHQQILENTLKYFDNLILKR